MTTIFLGFSQLKTDPPELPNWFIPVQGGILLMGKSCLMV